MKLCKRIITILIPTLLTLIIAVMVYSSIIHKNMYIAIILIFLMIISLRSVIVAVKDSTEIDKYVWLRLIFLLVNSIIVAISWLLIQIWDTAFIILPIINVLIFIIVLKRMVKQWREFLEIIIADPYIYYTLYIFILFCSVHI